MKKNNFRIETWKSSAGDEELQHFLYDHTYVFGFNKKLLGEKLYKIILALIKLKLFK